MNCSLLRAVLGAVASAPILIACSTVDGHGVPPPPPPSADFCGEAGNHCIVVSVDGTNTISLDSDYLRKHGPGQIRWRVENAPGQKFYFTDSGIVFRDYDGGKKVFDCHRVDAQFFLCKDSTGAPGNYKYTVTVTDGSSSPSEDPHILND